MLKRLAFLPVQVFGVATIVFCILRLFPNPAYAIAGPLASQQEIARFRANLDWTSRYLSNMVII